MLRKYVGLIVVISAPLMLDGCVGRVVSEGLGKVTGPKGITAEVQPVSSMRRDVSLEDYTQFKIERFTDNFGGRTPQRLLSMLPGQFYRELAKAKIHSRAGGKTLLIRGQVIHYEDSSTAMSQVFGPFEEVVARVELVDAESGKTLGVANCIGRSRETVNQGVEKKTEGLAEAIAGWIASHYPKNG
jgi:hypothetical protein